MTSRKKAFALLGDIGVAIAAGLIVAIGLHYFANANNFYPGGITGIAFVISNFTNTSRSLWLVVLNLPLFVAMSIFVDKKLGFFLSLYLIAQSAALSLLVKYDFPYYQTQNNLIIAAIGTGVVTGFGFALMVRHFGSSGGTYAISALIKRSRPGANVAWIAFAMDSSVVLLVFVLYGFQIEPAMCTLINLFLADAVVDEFLKGGKSAYRFEIVTDKPEEISRQIMEQLGHGVTLIQGEGMYTHTDRSILICVVRKRYISALMKLLRTFPDTFASFSKVNEVFGRFKR